MLGDSKQGTVMLNARRVALNRESPTKLLSLADSPTCEKPPNYCEEPKITVRDSFHWASADALTDQQHSWDHVS
jgi:hypothetical protein